MRVTAGMESNVTSSVSTRSIYTANVLLIVKYVSQIYRDCSKVLRWMQLPVHTLIARELWITACPLLFFQLLLTFSFPLIKPLLSIPSPRPSFPPFFFYPVLLSSDVSVLFPARLHVTRSLLYFILIYIRHLIFSLHFFSLLLSVHLLRILSSLLPSVFC